MPQTTNENLILTYAVLTGLTPLIPLPFVDDLARTHFRRQLVQKLAEANRKSLSKDAIQVLADEKSGSCLLGCLGTALIYPLKFIFRKLFFFLEWKRAIETASTTYYHGFLADYALQQGWCAPQSPHSPLEVRAAIDTVIEETDPRVINRAMRAAFVQSKSTLQSAVLQMTSTLRRENRQSAETVEQTLAGNEEVETTQVQNVVGQLQQTMQQLPANHFDTLRLRLAEILNETPR